MSLSTSSMSQEGSRTIPPLRAGPASGLPGNSATGKSVVRKMLEHLGAYGIDADALAHRAMAKGAPGHNLVLKAFGDWVLDDDGQIDRAKMAKIAFSDPEA